LGCLVLVCFFVYVLFLRLLCFGGNPLARDPDGEQKKNKNSVQSLRADLYCLGKKTIVMMMSGYLQRFIQRLVKYDDEKLPFFFKVDMKRYFRKHRLLHINPLIRLC